jgi:ubiquinone/menaquinone biosynthesis C-methylase UbiE
VFPQPAELSRRLAAHGFERVRYQLLMGGVCALYVATKA